MKLHETEDVRSHGTLQEIFNKRQNEGLGKRLSKKKIVNSCKCFLALSDINGKWFHVLQGSYLNPT